jgi:hypothetical protein
MAMLGLLELMASQGVNESDMYKAALAVNEYWFPDMYATISQFMSERGMDWKSADPKAVLGANFSSGQGFQAVSQELSKIQAERSGIPQGGSSGNQGGSCGV